MQNALYVEISAIGIMLMLIILFTQRQTANSSAAQRRFNSLIYVMITMLVVDAVCWLVIGRQFRNARELNYLMQSLYFALHIILPYIWALYVEGSLSTDLVAARKRIFVASIPLAIFLVALVFNLEYHFVFTIDADNVYHRAIGVYIYSLLSYVYLLYASIRALIKAKNATWSDDRRRYYMMAFFAVLPSVGGLIQLFYYGISLNWILASLSILLVYIDSQNRQISADPLTGLNNRRELTKYLLRETRDRDSVKNGALTVIMMDVDGFKLINDTYGHFFGDGILSMVAGILKESCKNSDAFLARYGGDEFCIVLPSERGLDVYELMVRIQTNLTEWNNKNQGQKPISLSIGHAGWDSQRDRDYETLIKRADLMMYEVKNAKKRA